MLLSSVSTMIKILISIHQMDAMLQILLSLLVLRILLHAVAIICLCSQSVSQMII